MLPPAKAKLGFTAKAPAARAQVLIKERRCIVPPANYSAILMVPFVCQALSVDQEPLSIEEDPATAGISLRFLRVVARSAKSRPPARSWWPRRARQRRPPSAGG